jgi:hypothetical protein
VRACCDVANTRAIISCFAAGRACTPTYKNDGDLLLLSVYTTMLVSSFLLAALPLCARALDLEPRGDLHFPLHARGTNKDASLPTYKNPKADIEARVADLLPRMTIEEKVAQLYVPILCNADVRTKNNSAYRATSTCT